jgi:hypothetical protein
MVTLKEKSLLEMSSTFNMTKIIWTLKKKNFMREMAQIHYILRKKSSHIAKTLLEVSISW